MKHHILLGLLGLAFFATPLTAKTVIIAESQPYVVVQEAPPAEITEVITPSPGPQYVWIKGRWKWENRWVWGPGSWSIRPHPNANWRAGYWERHGHHHHAWIEGRWE